MFGNESKFFNINEIVLYDYNLADLATYETEI